MITAINCKRMCVWAFSRKKKVNQNVRWSMPPSPSWWFNRIFVTAFTDRNELVELCHSVEKWCDWARISMPHRSRSWNRSSTRKMPHLQQKKGAVSRCSWVSLEFEHYVIQGSHKIILLPFEMGPLEAISSHPNQPKLARLPIFAESEIYTWPISGSTHRHIKNDKSHDC